MSNNCKNDWFTINEFMDSIKDLMDETLKKTQQNPNVKISHVNVYFVTITKKAILIIQ